MVDALADRADSSLLHSFLRPIVFYAMLLAIVAVTFSVALSSIAMGTAIVLWLYLVLSSKGKAFLRTPLDFLFLLYLIGEFIANIFSVDPASSWYNTKRFFLMSLVYLTLTSLDTEKKFRISLLSLAVVASVLSLVEVFSLSSVGGHFVRVSLFQYFLTEGGIKMFVMILLLPFLIHPSTPRKWKIYSLVCMIPLLIGLVLTQTRSAWLGFIAGVFTIGIMKNKKVIIALLILIVVFLLVAPQDFRTRAASIFDPTMSSNITRIHMITTGWRMFLDRPIAGWGDIDLRQYYVAYITPLDDAEGGHLHNNIMQLLVTLGIIGFVAIVAVFVAIFKLEFAAARSLAGHWLYGSAALGCFAAYIGFQVSGLFEWNFGDHEIAVLLWFTVGLALASQRLYEGYSSSKLS
ncbi:MAG: O-antigen ligase family protein [Ignavibacteria bacterium]|nr:O-antigen ligase family protein [Ignavibacteria bacterium]MBI3766005.1 O-antigen ligase family protein [Ignavibacteriales bacterium]